MCCKKEIPPQPEPKITTFFLPLLVTYEDKVGWAVDFLAAVLKEEIPLEVLLNL